MKLFARFTCVLVVLFMTLLALPGTAGAVPSLPSSFYGTVTLDGANVPDGTVIEAFVAGSKVAQSFSQTYQGNSVYSLDVPGDDTDTAAQDGGREGDTVVFKIGGLEAQPGGIWHMGTNAEVNLAVSAGSDPIAPPQPTYTPWPTQTPMSLPATAVATAMGESIPTVEPTVPAVEPPATEPSVLAVQPTPIVTALPTPDGKGNQSGNLPIIAGAVVLLGAAGALVWFLKKK